PYFYCHALPCKVSSLVAVETLHLGLVKPNSFFVGHVQLPSSILQKFSCPHSQHSNVHLKSISYRSSGLICYRSSLSSCRILGWLAKKE
ncbi:hypothetical protein Tco_0165717, partial [Tanacetum coccineum]